MTFAEAAMIMMSGGKKPNIKPLSVTANGSYESPEGVDGYNPVNVNVPSEAVTEGLTVTSNGTYTPPSGVDGFNPVSVSVPDRYDEGYADGESAVKAKIQSKSITANGVYYAVDDGLDGFDPINVSVPERYDEGYNDGYSDGYDFAESFYNNVIDSTKRYTIVIYLGDEIEPGLHWLMVDIYNTSDMSRISSNNWWPTAMQLCYNARFTKIWWEYGNATNYNKPRVEIESTDKSGANKARYSTSFSNGQVYPYSYNPYNTNIISSIPTS